MPVLSNSRYERFAQALAKGVPPSQAYAQAGFAKNRPNAHRFARRAEIGLRVQELREQLDRAERQVIERIIEKHALTKEKVLQELMLIGFTNIADFVDVSGPTPVFRLQNVPREKLAAISELTTVRRRLTRKRRRDDDNDGEVVKVRLKFWDKRAALIDLGKHLGLFQEEKDGQTTFVKVVQKALSVPLDQIPPPPWLKDITPPRKRGEE